MEQIHDVSYDEETFEFDELYKSYSTDGLRELARTLFVRNEELARCSEIMRKELNEQDAEIEYLHEQQDGFVKHIEELSKQINKYKTVVKALSALV